MMREAVIILPHGPKGSLRAHMRLRHELLDAFGGFTQTRVSGQWRDDDGKVHLDESIQYTIAVLWNAPAGSVLAALARDAGVALAQKCVYVRYPDGNVELVTCCQ